MNLKNTRIAVVGAFALTALVALPVAAHAGQQERRQANRRAPAAEQRTAPRNAPAPRATPASPAPRTQGRASAAPRAQATPPRPASRPDRAVPPRTPQAPPRANNAPRSYETPRPPTAPRSYATPPRAYAVPRGSVASRGPVAPRGVFLPPRIVRFPQPYYRFQPRLRLSFGLYIGSPVAYPYNRYDPFAYPGYGSLYGYDRYGVPSRASYGGLSFDIQPYDADLYVDGYYVGRVSDFSRYAAPLTLAVGVHHIDLTAEGFQTMSFDITVVGGQVIPYQGAMAFIRY
jgi:PEGA domain